MGWTAGDILNLIFAPCFLTLSNLGSKRSMLTDHLPHFDMANLISHVRPRLELTKHLLKAAYTVVLDVVVEVNSEK